MKVFKDNGLDIDRWYPPARQIAGQLKFMRIHKRGRAHHKRSLDTFSQQANARCGPLSVLAASAR